MTRPAWQPLALLLATSGALHFAKPEPFAAIVPRRLGDPQPWVYASGAAELACAAGLATLARLPIQVPLVLWALRLSRRAARVHP